ncbi:hypothetical protein ABE189_00400 [Bacillus subtilis]|mgnify:CR=1 FL=1|nr:hypothetical protein [Bacillus subtilis]MBR9948426.1 hypothetical protein [Bacillus subtilis]MED1810788.1 hypothetical protein [Bacillus subtilis]QKJ77985.1 hypothetical protein HR084_10315 [Bacillus subtilis]UML54792.1 hypothetical protein MKS87_10395 [Bacillus subtilis]UYP01466.1 hypothetical protein OEG95_10275 [Bacillus subtilis]
MEIELKKVNGVLNSVSLELLEGSKEKDSEVIAVHQSLLKESLPFGYFD